jgi:hypothetical protein
MSARTVTRLPFRLPPSTRVAWVSDRARATWLPRMEAVAAALSALELESVAAGARAAAISICPAEGLADLCQRAAARGLAIHPCERRRFAGRSVMFDVVVARPQRIPGLGDAVESARTRASLIGAPACCAEFLAATEKDGWLDSTWPAALRSGPSHDLVVQVSAGSSVNTLLRPLGVYPVFHAPCAFGCRETLASARGLLELGRSIHLEQEMEWLDEILSWPTLWSSLHGLAEVKSPILRMVTTTDATGERIEIRCLSDRYPAERASGIRFPYRDGGGSTLATAVPLQIRR